MPQIGQVGAFVFIGTLVALQRLLVPDSLPADAEDAPEAQIGSWGVSDGVLGQLERKVTTSSMEPVGRASWTVMTPVLPTETRQNVYPVPL